MNEKGENGENISNVVLHENSPLTPYEDIHPVPSASQRTVLSTGERKPSRHIFSHSHDTTEEASNLASKRHTREASRLADQSINHNIDVTSAYALQIALKNMKERYQKLQKKISVLEEENGRLINGKSELFSEIGKMQDSSIKLREKNLQLNHEVHSKHQECCSLQEQFSNVSKENLRLNTQLSQSDSEKRTLMKKVEDLRKENLSLKGGLEEILIQCKRLPNAHSEFSLQVEGIANKSLNKTRFDSYMRTKIIPSAEDLEHPDDFGKMLPDEISFAWDELKDDETLALDVCLKATEFMKKIATVLQTQNHHLNELKPHVLKGGRRKDSNEVNISSENGKTFLSNLATCSSAPHPSGVHLISEELAECVTIDDSGGETNVLVEEVEEENERKVPFDWRKLEVSDDEAAVDFPASHRPETRTVSTSPDLTLTFDLGMRQESRELSSSEEDRTCPMCNAVFPLLLPQETFESHVVSHFEVENGFEVIT